MKVSPTEVVVPWQPLGQRVTYSKPEEPVLRQIAPGILQDMATGRLQTNIPVSEAEGSTPWPWPKSRTRSEIRADIEAAMLAASL